MDAQNAGEPTSTKPAASPKRMGSDVDQPRSSAVTKLSSIAKPELSVKDSSRSSVSGLHSSSHDDNNNNSDGNSDAETIVLPGKDGQHSPSKVRKHIKHEDKSDGEDTPPISSIGRKHSNMKQQDRDRDSDANNHHSGRNERGDRGERGDKGDNSNNHGSSNNAAADRESGSGAAAASSALGAKKKKHPDKAKNKDGSSGLSSAPASPPQRRRRLSNAHSKSDSEPAPVDSPKTSAKEKQTSTTQHSKQQQQQSSSSSVADSKVVPHKRKATRPESDDEAESRKVRRQRTSGSGLDASRKPHLPSGKSHHEVHSSANRTRSPSPPPARPHRRSISSQLPGQSSNGLSQKKKRIPAPLQSTDYHSDESSASGSPHPRSSKLRNLATPATAESTVSPMKMAPHKKHLDAHGQTFLARACAKGEYEIAKQRLKERPEDINVADYAGNTPLQIAALNGYEDIVKLLVDAGCNLDCVNNEKDTPLLDAVENGHLGVVKILLDAGVNPRKANANGEEPLFRIDEGTEHAAEIKRALMEAKKKMGERRMTSEDHQLEHFETASTYGAESPQRRSPGTSGTGSSTHGRRANNSRSNKTSNHLLYVPMDDKTLRIAAGKGDEVMVERILQVREGLNDPESMVAAARGGHEMVLQLLLALGTPNPDPPPIPTDPSNSEYATPMLAAIGQENIKVIRLLLDQAEFNPTQRYKGETYYEIARRRQGPNWIEEEEMLRNAYQDYMKTHKANSKAQAQPNKREQSRESRKNRVEPSNKDDGTPRSHKRKASSPTREGKKSSQAKVSTSPKEKQRSNSFSGHPEEQTSPKRGPGRPKKEDRIPTIAISDREASPAGKPSVKKRAADADLAAASSEGEAVKPRRKLVSAREFKGEQKNRRASLTSNASTLKEPSSPREDGEKVNKLDRYHDRTKALKRDESRDRLSVAGESTGKRHRASATPPHPGAGEKEPAEAPAKKRRLDADGKERRLKPTSSDDKHLKAPTSRDSASSPGAASRTSSKGARDDEDRRHTPKPKKAESGADQARRDLPKSFASEHNVRVKDEDMDIDMPDADPPARDNSEARVSSQKKRDDDEKKRQQASNDDALAREAKRKEEDRKRREEEEREKELQEKKRLRAAAEETKRRAEAEARQREEDEQRQKAELERQRREEEERKKREEEEEEEERKQKEQEERRQEEERRQRAEEEKRQKEEEEERKRRAEEDRIRREQLERQAAEEAEAQRRREEEERNERERERVRREEAEQRAREAERKRRAEQEQARVQKLPPLLRWLETAVNPKQPEVASLFSLMQGVRYDCIDTSANGTPEGREQWLLNTQVALLLGEKDLDLSRYTAWPRKPVPAAAKSTIWRLEAGRYALLDHCLFELGRQLPEGYYEGQDPEHMDHQTAQRLKAKAWDKFSAMDMFFVKVSDFMYIVPNIPHLRNVELLIQYREFAADGGWITEKKYKSDPDAARYLGYVPNTKHYLNGQLLPGSKSGAQVAVTSSVPFQTHKVVRRGWTAVSPDDPEYSALLSKQQSRDGSVGDMASPRLANGAHNSSPMSTSSHHMMPGVTNGVRSPVLATATAAAPNGAPAHHHHHALDQPISPTSESGPAQARPLANGTHGLTNGDNEDDGDNGDNA
ncbi:hypothetical protein QBC35DRAFT_378900 [Podospora australis]|uniref:Ankyrin repeat protein n=1 Tax=Podospora australis TaxID=1536484 RepID=A0AAN6WYP9_9PEZI|nr:hypothetical protein QBC35DRAFT_378900 [Podospora australis]